MSNPVWDPSLPQEAFAGYRVTVDDLRLQVRFDSGRTKRRALVSKSPQRFTIPLKLDGDQLDTVLQLIEDTNNGSTPFDWIDPKSPESASTAMTFEFEKIPEFSELVGGATKAERLYSCTLNLKEVL